MPKDESRFSLADTLRCVLPFAHKGLIADPARRRLLSLASQLPPLARGLLECRFDGQAPVDLSQSVLDTEEERSALLACFAQMRDGSCAWEQVLRFMDDWQGGPDTDRYAWFEYDLDEDTATPAPSVFLSVGARGGDHGWALGSLGPEAEAIVDRWLKRLPEGAQVDFIGAMLPRDPMRLRLNLSGLGADAAWTWLRANGCNLPEIARDAFTTLFEIGTPVLAVEILPDCLGPRIGIECRPTDAQSATAILALCQAHKLCPPEALEMLHGWRGTTSGLETQSGFPIHLILESLTREDAAPAILVRDINHIKVSLSEAGLEQAKVYLSFRYQHDESLSLPR